MKKVIITGGTKLIGSHLAEVLVERGYDVHVTTSAARKREHPEGMHVHTCDVRDLDGMKKLSAGAEYIFHLAAHGDQYCIDHPLEGESVNAGGTIAVLAVARALGVKKVAFASSATVYGEQNAVPLREELPAMPNEPYGLYKYWGERAVQLWARQYAVPAVSLRIFNAYGPRDVIEADGYVVGRFLHLRMKGEPITIDGDGTSTRDYVHAHDIARAFLLAAEYPTLRGGEVLNIGSGIETSLNDLAAFIGGPIVRTESRSGARRGPSRRVADINRAKNMLGWKPTIPLAEGITALKRELGIE